MNFMASSGEVTTYSLKFPFFIALNLFRVHYLVPSNRWKCHEMSYNLEKKYARSPAKVD